MVEMQVKINGCVKTLLLQVPRVAPVPLVNLAELDLLVRPDKSVTPGLLVSLDPLENKVSIHLSVRDETYFQALDNKLNVSGFEMP